MVPVGAVVTAAMAAMVATVVKGVKRVAMAGRRHNLGLVTR